MIKYDYHIHTNHSADSDADINMMVQRAIKLDLEEIAITDHIDFTYPDNAVVSPHGIVANIQAVRAAQKKYAGKIKIRVGAEVNMRPDSAEVCKKIAENRGLDIIIGAVHEMENGIDFGFPALYKTHTKHEAYMTYFKAVRAAVLTCDSYDVLAHIDYVERYGSYDDSRLFYAEYSDIVDEILRIIISKGKGMEINTSGLAYGLGRTHPQQEIISRYVELGGEIITVGSDAHTPQRVGQGLGRVYDMLKEIGVRYIAQYEGRRVRHVRI